MTPEKIKARCKPYANLRVANLREASLYGASLYGASLYGADLYGADLCGADLRGANLREASLYGASLYGASLYEADLCGADLRGANLREASLYGASLCGADLRGANLREVDLRGAKLRGVNHDSETKWPRFQIPQEGPLIVYKKLANGVVAKLEIPSNAKRTASLVGRKCRAEFAKVLEGKGPSLHRESFEYRPGNIVRPDKYDDNPLVECTNGIHFFLTREEAEEY